MYRMSEQHGIGKHGLDAKSITEVSLGGDAMKKLLSYFAVGLFAFTAVWMAYHDCNLPIDPERISPTVSD